MTSEAGSQEAFQLLPGSLGTRSGEASYQVTKLTSLCLPYSREARAHAWCRARVQSPPAHPAPGTPAPRAAPGAQVSPAPLSAGRGHDWEMTTGRAGHLSFEM